jgi:multicomponent Na+:H+ antiporter subunit C
MTVWLLIAVLAAVGMRGLLSKRHVLKKILGVVILEHAVNLFLVAIGYRAGGAPPILGPDMDPAAFVRSSVDPLPQALVLTSIVIGLGLVMLLVALALRLHERTGTLDADALTQLKG